MNGYLAIGAVSAVLRSLLTTALTNGGPSTLLTSPQSVSATSPDLVPTGADEQPRLNLFMYYASLNAAYRNVDLPSRDATGARIGNPPLALNLHYLVSAYGGNQFDPEILLGWAMEVFNNNPKIARSTISDALAALGASTEEVKLVAQSALASQFEELKLTQEALSNEEISRLWMAFSTHYRPTTSYQVSVVLIQDSVPVRSNLPVQKRNLVVLPMDIPVIEAITPGAAVTGSVITLSGRNFMGDVAQDTQVTFQDGAPVVAETVQPRTIRVKVPATALAGTVPVRVVRNVKFGTPSDPYPAFESGSFVFQILPLLPDLTPVTPASVVTVARGTDLTLTINPAVGRAQRARLFAGSQVIEIPARPQSAPDTSMSLTFPIPADWNAFQAPLRVEIDGAQSLLVQDTTQGSPTAGQFFPQIEVTV